MYLPVFLLHNSYWREKTRSFVVQKPQKYTLHQEARGSVTARERDILMPCTPCWAAIDTLAYTEAWARAPPLTLQSQGGVLVPTPDSSSCQCRPWDTALRAQVAGSFDSGRPRWLSQAPSFGLGPGVSIVDVWGINQRIGACWLPCFHTLSKLQNNKLKKKKRKGFESIKKWKMRFGFQKCFWKPSFSNSKIWRKRQ